MVPLFLVDGPRSGFRTKVADTLAERYVAMRATGTIQTTPETYVRMMSQAIDQQRPVVIECSWITQERHAKFMSQVSQNLFKHHNAQRRMLYRLALGCGALCVQCMDIENDLAKEWLHGDPLIPTMAIGDWDEYLFSDLEYRMAALENPGPGIGQWAPHQSILLVGDQHGDTVQPYNLVKNVAFCSMSGKGCSEWLTAQLEAAGLGEHLFYWINAREPKSYSGRATPSGFLSQLNPYMTIALGSIAEQWCIRAGIPYRTVPHPQSWKRFHFHETYPLIPLLKEIIDARGY